MGLRASGYVPNLDHSWVFDKGSHGGMEMGQYGVALFSL